MDPSNFDIFQEDEETNNTPNWKIHSEGEVCQGDDGTRIYDVSTLDQCGEAAQSREEECPGSFFSYS